MTHTGRKRSRPCDDDACDFTPISKRINNLHIRSALHTANDDSNSTEAFRTVENISPQFQNRVVNRIHVSQSQNVSMNEAGKLVDPNCCCCSTSSELRLPPTFSCTPSEVYHYCPELSARENPHYYQINRLLFELHINRIQRTGKQ